MTSTDLTDSVPTTTDTAPTDVSRRNRLVINLMLVSTFVVALNETVMSIALPRLITDLGITATTGQWLTAASLLTTAIVVPTTGAVMQRFSTRQVFLAAMTLFTVGTAVAAAAPGFEMLLGGRIIQAVGTALMLPLLMTTAVILEPPATRGRRMGTINIVISVAPAIGPALAGLVLGVLPWRFLFLLMLPVVIVVLLVGARRMQNVTEIHPARIDALSVVLSAFGFGGLVFGLSHIGDLGTGSTLFVVIPLAVGVVALVAFIARQIVLQRVDAPLLDLRTLRTRNFTLSLGVLIAGTIAFFGTLILLPLYTQNALGFSVLQSGLVILPGGVVLALTSPLFGRISDRLGPRPLLITGTILVTAMLATLSLFTDTTPWWWLLPVHIVLCIGLSMTFTGVFSVSLGSLPPHLYGHGSAMLNTLQQVAGAIGTALFVSTMAAVATAHTVGSAEQATASGVGQAFLVGAVISVAGIALAPFVTRTRDTTTAG